MSAGTGTTGTPAIRQPVIASTVGAVGLASTATCPAVLVVLAMRSAAEVAAPTRSPRLSDTAPMRTASPMSAAAAGSNEASNTMRMYSTGVLEPTMELR